VDYLKQAVRIKPRNAYAWNNLGNWHYAAGRYDEAGEHYRRAIESDGPICLAWYNLGNVETATGCRAKAKRALPEAWKSTRVASRRARCSKAARPRSSGGSSLQRPDGGAGESLWAFGSVVVQAPVWVGVFAAVFAVVRAGFRRKELGKSPSMLSSAP
jgi:tetratricopeptide (TPR) repeat protein